jgi:hypothetical protein
VKIVAGILALLLAGSLVANAVLVVRMEREVARRDRFISLGRCLDGIRFDASFVKGTPENRARIFLAEESYCLAHDELPYVLAPPGPRLTPREIPGDTRAAMLAACIAPLKKLPPNSMDALAGEEDCLRMKGFPALRDLRELSGWPPLPPKPTPQR